MANKPRVQEIFSNQASNFRYEEQETREQIKLPGENGGEKSKKGLAPQPPTGMKKYGGYKPKILEGQDDLIEVQNRAAILALNEESFPVVSGKSKPAPHPPAPQLTKPKLWVVGDKNVPMVLGGRARDDWSGQGGTDSGNDGSRSNIATGNEVFSDNDMSNGHGDQAHRSNLLNSHSNNYRSTTANDIDNARRSFSETSIVSETSTLVQSSLSGNGPEGFDNPALGSLDSLAFPDRNNNKENDIDIDSKLGPDEILDFDHAFMNNSYIPLPLDEDSQSVSPEDSEQHLYEEPVIESEAVYIPEPDYEEDEKTLDFNSEGTSGDEEDGGDRLERRPGFTNGSENQRRMSFPIRQYEGEDLSRYLSDDESDSSPVPETPSPPVTNGKSKSKKSGSKKSKNDISNMRPKVSQKHSLFKNSGSSTQSKSNKKGKSSKNVVQAPAFNSVRSFSYADSKYGTKGRAISRSMMSLSQDTFYLGSEPADDSDMFLSASTQDSTYESFLRSRHSQSMPPESSDSGVEMADDGGGSAGGGVWRKLTWRLRNKSGKNYSLAQ
ncbi:hypothetical protein PoB_007449900 [Plakobranchus ocellatus]|uniref:Uncharacterized protein n=1 Tax=Plakobranchus ocellatus TaxID=259542 RepID=A0AAV4DUS0_9GAST|nr:hypothetical protein PoB_007449900 [Plakobranchus ocellatus]